MKQTFYLMTLLLLFFTVACEQTLENNEEINETNMPVTSLKGDWTVNAYINDSINYGPFIISADYLGDDGAIRLKDNGDFWKFQTKVKIGDMKNEFETHSSVNEISSIGAKINILNGQIVNKDSISFDIQFEDDETPYGFTYKIKGHRKL